VADHTADAAHPNDDRLLKAAAAALKKRRELDREIARLVAEPFDAEAPARVRDAQAEADQAGDNLDRERTAHHRPIADPSIDDPDPRRREESSWHD
jgi:hypothetical protein